MKLRWFSFRKGLKKVRETLQVDSIDDALRNRLWNVFLVHYIHPMRETAHDQDQMREVMEKFWDKYLKLPIDKAPYLYEFIWKETNGIFQGEWYGIFDFLEFVVANYTNEKRNEHFRESCNTVLEEELSAYRFVGKQITEITSEEEISEIEEALAIPLKPVKVHLEKALQLMSDRESPDYRNSIKESISAVEAICKLIAHDRNAALGQALGKIREEVGLHGALERGFSSLYGYTSNAEGIRHALLEEPSLSFDDAKFMVVSCSAFINYLISKASKTGIELKLD